MEDEAPPDARFDFWPALRRLANGSDAFFDCCFEPFRRVRVARQVPKERGTSFFLGTLLDTELPVDHDLLTGEDASPGLVPPCEGSAPGVNIGEALSQLVAPRTLNLGCRLSDAVEKLEREECTLLVRKRACLLENLVGRLAHE